MLDPYNFWISLGKILESSYFGSKTPLSLFTNYVKELSLFHCYTFWSAYSPIEVIGKQGIIRYICVIKKKSSIFQQK